MREVQRPSASLPFVVLLTSHRFHHSLSAVFVTFEGIDGSGKTTLARRVALRLRQAGRSVVEVREPGGTALGETVRHLLLDPAGDVSPRAEVLLFSAARAHLVDVVIRPALERGEVVIADRFFDSTTAYQGGGRGVMDWNEADALNTFATAGLRPDITFLVDLDPSVAAKRRASTGNDRMESAGETFYRTVRAAYLEIAQRDQERIVELDGMQSPERLEAAVLSALSQR